MHFKNTNTKSAQYEKFHDAYKKNNNNIKKKKQDSARAKKLQQYCLLGKPSSQLIALRRP